MTTRRKPSIKWQETLGKGAMQEYGWSVVRLETALILTEDIYRQDPTEENRQRVLKARVARDAAMEPYENTSEA